MFMLTACVIYAATDSYQLRPAGTSTTGGNTFTVVYDSGDAHDKVNNDTVMSDTLDVSDYARAAVFYGLGNVTVCDSCNDSIKIFIEVLGKPINAQGWYRIRVDTMGGNNIAVTFDDSTKARFLYLDTIPVNKLIIRTIVRDSMKQYTVPTGAFAGRYTTTIPMIYTVSAR
jgi:hypothetical protein